MDEIVSFYVNKLYNGHDSYNEIYNWLVVNNELDVYNYLKLIYIHRKQYKQNSKYLYDIHDFVVRYNLFYFITRCDTPDVDYHCINKHMMEFYKDKRIKLRSIPYNLYTTYFKSLVGFIPGMLDYRCIENITIPAIKIILKYNRNSIQPGLTYSNVNFIIDCKKVNYDKRKIMAKLSLVDWMYDMADKEYLGYINSGFGGIASYMNYRKLKTDAIACMEYIKAMQNSIGDLDTNEVVVSKKSINRIIKNANIDQYLKY